VKGKVLRVVNKNKVSLQLLKGDFYMLKLKEILKKPILGITMFFMCAFLVLIGLGLAGFGSTLRRKNNN